MAAIKEIMTPNAETIQSPQTVKEAATRMKEIDTGALPVFDGNKLTGILTDRDIIVRSLAESLDPSVTTVGEIMTKDVVTCNENDAVENAAAIMEKNKIRRLLVKGDSGMITGIVSLGDVAVNADAQVSGEVLKEVAQPSEPKR
ncbi:MAG: CBS domain-containing protein [Chitinivibrionales bacterium]|nr:CBS domain-containing protein [Chitinivibrionales bacterium]